MSYSKQVLFGNDPADDAARAVLRANAEQVWAQFTFKIPARRKNRLGTSPRWDPFWPHSLHTAAKQLGIDVVNINDQVCTRTQEEADQVKAAAEVILKTSHRDFVAWRQKR